MGNKDKRAKRSKLKAKVARISKQANKSKYSVDKSYKLNPSSIEIFERMSNLNDESDRLRVLHNYLEDTVEGFNEDPEMDTLIMYEMYKKWKSEREVSAVN